MNASQAKRSFRLPPASRVLLAAWVATCCWAAIPAEASRALRAGDPPFIFGASYVRSPQPGEPIWIRISYSGFYDRSAVADMHIDVPRGLEVVEGETERHAAPSHDPWFLKVLPLHPGLYEIHGSMRTTAADHVDEAEFVLPFRVRPDAIEPELYRETRLERVESGQRYRYAYDYLVPIRDAQPLTEVDIVRGGGKPAAIQTKEASCGACRLAAPVSVPVRVLVDENGAVLESQAVSDDPALASDVVNAALQAAREWRFRPARANGIVTRDRVDIDVTVH